MNRARWIAALCLYSVIVLAYIPVCTARASSSVNGSFSVSETEPPATISLFVTNQSYTSVTLSWIAPGDDGNVGVAAEYDIRYSASAIDTEVKWQAATKVANPPFPKVAGSAENFIVDGLSTGSTYYFAIKTADEVPNWSGLSNSPRGNTLRYSRDGGGTTGPSKPPSTEPSSIEERGPTTGGLLEINMMGQESSIEIRADGTLGKALTLTDRDGNFILDIDSGTKLTGSDGAALSNMEVKVVNKSIVVPDNILVLSPIYELTGYNRNMEITRISFEPAARLTIRYDPQKLSENTFLPFVANYTNEQGMVRLQPSPDFPVETGKVKTLVGHASLFFVAAEVSLPPPPLPARFKASNLTINPKQAYLGQTVTISLTVANEGATAGKFELHLIIDGITREIEELTLTGNSSETLTFEVSNLAIGSHQVKVAGLTGRFDVVVTVVSPPMEPGFNWLLLDTSVGAALAICLLVLYLVARRSRR